MKARTTSSVRTALATTIAAAVSLFDASAADIFKANNTTALNLTGSWVGGVVPGAGDVAVWDNTVLAANASALGAGVVGGVSWLGIRIANPGGIVTIGNTTTAAGGDLVNGTTDVLTLGTSGIDMSAATQNLLINGNLTIGGNQTWQVANGRTLQIQTINTNARMTGSGDLNLVNSSGTGTATFDFRPGTLNSSGFTDQNGFFGYSGNWTINSGVLVKSLRNGQNAWGSGTITLNGGTIAEHQNFNGTWTNNIILQSGSSSTIDDANTANARTLKLQGVISGDSTGNLTFAETGGGSHSVDGGYILTNTNTLAGLVTITSGTVVRIGGVPGADASTTFGSSGTLGTATVVNNGTITLSRDNTWTFANNVSGSGLLRIGLVSGSATHIVTVSGNNTHSGGTTLQTAVTLKIGSTNALGTGTFTIAGNGIFDNATGSQLTVANAFTLSGGSPTFTGTNDMTINGATLISVASRSITVSASTLTLGGNITEDTAGRGLTKAGAGSLALSGANTYTGTTTISAGTLSISGGAAIADSSNVVLANSVGATLLINSSETIAGLSGGGATGGNVNVNGQTLTITPPAAHSDFNGALVGTGTVIKAGANQLRLGGTNTFSGTIQIGGGLAVFTSLGADDGTPNVVINGDVNTGLVIGDVFAGGKVQIGSLSGTGGKVRADWNAVSGQRTLSVTQSADTTFAGSFEDASTGARSVGLEKNGSGKLTLTGASANMTGTTTINNGTLEAATVDALGGTSTVTINTGGTLLLSGAGDHVKNGANIILAGGTFNTGGFSETVGALTLSTSSVIDFGNGASVLTFASADTANWNASAILSIFNWSGSVVAGGGVDRLVFSSSSLTQTQLDNIRFFSDSGATQVGTGTSFLGSPSFEVVPVPEPSAVVAGLGLLGFAGWRERRNLRAQRRATRLAVARL